MKNKMKKFRVETEDRYGRFNEYDIQAETLELATLIANKRVNLPNGAFMVDIKEIPEVQESTQKIEGELPVREYDKHLPNGIQTTPREYAYGKEIVRDSDGSAVIGWYDDNDGNDIRCRD